MKKYYIYSTLSFVLVSLLIEIMMSSQSGFTTFAGFNWFISTDLINTTNLLSWSIQGLALSFAAFLYIKQKSAMYDGVRFGLIAGFLFTLIILFNMMWQIDHSHYPFLANSLLSLTGLQILGFTLSGWIFGLMYEIYSPKLPTIKSLWSLA